MNYIQKIKRIRQIHGETQKDIAELLNISQQQYSLIETEKRELYIEQLIKICIHYNVSADYLLNIKLKK